ncbi:MAG: hypothetical protein Q7K40_04960 [bacterium]|nr:hypothetical protein [bacterium]
MNPEKNFNPSNPEYKEVKDLPQEEQKNFVDVEGGFVMKEALEHVESANEDAALRNKRRGILQKLFNVSEVSELEVLHEEAFSEDKTLDNAKQEERIEKEREEYEMRRQETIERERVLEEEWKNSEEFKKLALFEEFLTTKPKFEEVNSILHNLSKNYFNNRTEASFELFKKARQLTYKKCLPCLDDNSFKEAQMMPSDFSSIADDLEFIAGTKYNKSGYFYPYPNVNEKSGENYIDIHRIADTGHHGGIHSINSSLAIAAIYGYYNANFTAREVGKYASSLLTNIELSLGNRDNYNGYLPDNFAKEIDICDGSRNAYLSNYNNLVEAFNLRDHDGESISEYFPKLNLRLKKLEGPLKKMFSMDKQEYVEYKKEATARRLSVEKKEEEARQADAKEMEVDKMNKVRERQESEENEKKQRELSKKLLG